VSDEQGRVKPCLECEELFDFDLSYCPSCGSLAVPVEGERCMVPGIGSCLPEPVPGSRSAS
jgi:hypothetical protein